MKNPTKEQMQVVIDNMKKALKISKANHLKERNGHDVRMMEGCLWFECNTPMCFGGWYAVINRDRIPESRFNQDFSHGMDMIAEDLGFEGMYELKQWADMNPKIWGNVYGDNLYTHMSAFGVGDNTNGNLEDIIKHLQKVKRRLS